MLLACWLPVSGCGTTRLENRVDGAPLNAPLFTNPSINRYYTRLSRDISSISIISILGNRTFRGGAREKEKENDKFLIFIIDEARFVKFIRVGGKS